MSRKLYRVPLDFSWPLNKVWEGYLNPYRKLCGKCLDCNGSGYAPRAKIFSDQWYGNAAFDPVSYGATPLSLDHPSVQAFARDNVNRHPDFYMLPEERRAARENRLRAGIDLMELYPRNEHERELYGSGPALVPIESFRGPAIAREAARLFDLWKGQWCHHLIQADVDALAAERRLMDFTHRPRNEEQAAVLKAQEADGGSSYWLAEPNGHTPTADEVNAWSLDGMSHMGHSSQSRYYCVKARCQREGVPFLCPTCNGNGEAWPTETAKQLYDVWTPSEPPAGDGYQLWETCSEGSPVSPVFATLDELCEHAESHCSTFATSNFVSKERWREMLDDGLVYHQEGHMVFL